MKYRFIGEKDNSLKVSSLGLGCMGMSEFYGATDESESIATLNHALDSGVDFFDTSDFYGDGANEILLGKAFKGKREDVVIATKFGVVRSNPKLNIQGGVNGSAEYVKKACEASLKRLNTDYIDLYYLHRLDPDTPIEETVGAMKELIEEGKIGHIGLSEVGADILKRAHAVHPVTAIQTEYSLWSRGVETNGILDTCKELNIGFVAYSPLGRGFLTSKIKDTSDMANDDFRKGLPRFQKENIEHNLKLVSLLDEIAKEKKCTPAQLSLAWLLAKGNYIVPIPGTKRISYLNENIGSVDVTLLDNEIAKLDKLSKELSPKGERYSSDTMRYQNLED